MLDLRICLKCAKRHGLGAPDFTALTEKYGVLICSARNREGVARGLVNETCAVPEGCFYWLEQLLVTQDLEEDKR